MRGQSTFPTSEEWLLDIGGGVRVNVRQDGVPHGTPILLIHAFAGSLRQWDDVATQLAARHWVIRSDLLGHGASDKPVAGYSMPEMAERVARVVSILGAGHFFAVGHSGGGGVVVALLENPELAVRIKGAIVIGTPPNLSFVNLPALANIYSVPLLGWLMWRITPRKMLKDAMANLFAPDYADVPDVVVDDFQRMTRHSYVQSKAQLEAFAASRALSDRVSQSTVPLRVVFGEMDQWIPAVCTQEWQRATNASIMLLSGIGHTPPLEDPAGVAQLIADFVKDVDESRSDIG